MPYALQLHFWLYVPDLMEVTTDVTEELAWRDTSLLKETLQRSG